jgi:hypothetical protein
MICESLIKSGIAGISIVSAYMVIVTMELRIASTFHVENGILTEDEDDDVAIDVSLNFRLPELFVSIIISSTPVSNVCQLPKYS